MNGIKPISAVCPFLIAGLTLMHLNAAQPTNTVRITGRVIDVSGSPIAGTAIKLSAVRSARSLTAVLSDNNGEFVFSSVLPGQYWLQFDLPGFLSRRVRLTKVVTEHDVHFGPVILQIGEVTEDPISSLRPSKKLKPVTVCEALAHRKRFSGKPIAIIGRIDCGSSLIGHICFLAEDRCEQPVRSDGYTWLNEVMIIDYWEQGMPKPPAIMPEIDQNTLARKLSMVRKSTTLGWHKEPRFKTSGRSITFSHFARTDDEWVLAYGILFTPLKLKDNCGVDMGCNRFDGAPAALITTPDALRTLASGSHRHASQ
jgi:hypothetical protein